jgi:hypothetical protein
MLPRPAVNRFELLQVLEPCGHGFVSRFVVGFAELKERMLVQRKASSDSL